MRGDGGCERMLKLGASVGVCGLWHFSERIHSAWLVSEINDDVCGATFLVYDSFPAEQFFLGLGVFVLSSPLSEKEWMNMEWFSSISSLSP